MNQNSNTAVSYINNFNIKSKKDLILSNDSFEKWRQFIYTSCGIYFQDNKKYLLESRLLKRLHFLEIDTFEKYFDFVKFNSNGRNEIKYLHEVITINETFFFRNPPQLDALITTILPEIIATKKKEGKNKIKIWSAASSSGEEAYSISMSILDLIKPKHPAMDFEIVGTDLSNAVIETAQKGIYKEYSIRNTPPYYLKKYFKKNGSAFELDPKIKEPVSFKILNLYDDMGMRAIGNFDVIFCANVLIYFDTKSKIKVISNIYNSLNKGGYLFIGYSETLQNISKAFKLCSFPKTIGYKKE